MFIAQTQYCRCDPGGVVCELALHFFKSTTKTNLHFEIILIFLDKARPGENLNKIVPKFLNHNKQ